MYGKLYENNMQLQWSLCQIVAGWVGKVKIMHAPATFSVIHYFQTMEMWKKKKAQKYEQIIAYNLHELECNLLTHSTRGIIKVSIIHEQWAIFWFIIMHLEIGIVLLYSFPVRMDHCHFMPCDITVARNKYRFNFYIDALKYTTRQIVLNKIQNSGKKKKKEKTICVCIMNCIV